MIQNCQNRKMDNAVNPLQTPRPYDVKADETRIVKIAETTKSVNIVKNRRNYYQTAKIAELSKRRKATEVVKTYEICQITKTVKLAKLLKRYNDRKCQKLLKRR